MYFILRRVAVSLVVMLLSLTFVVELYNSQVMLKGLETPGYVIVGAAKASILSRDHQPVWKDRNLKSKTTWVGSVECMQVIN